MIPHINSLLNKCTQSSFIRSVGVLTGGNVLSQIIIIATSPLLTRLYTPDQIGVLTAFTSIMFLLLVCVSLRFETAIPIPRQSAAAVNLLALSIVISIFISAIYLCIFLNWGKSIVTVLKMPNLLPYLPVLSLCIFSTGVMQALNNWCIRQSQFGQVSANKVIQSVVLVATQLSMSFSGSLGLLLGVTAGRIAGVAALTRTTVKENRSDLKAISLLGMKGVAVEYRKFPLLSSWSAVFNMAADQLPYLLLGVYYGPTVLGWFALAQRVLGLPFAFIGASIGEVYVIEASKLLSSEHDKHRINMLFWRLVKNTFLIGLPILAFIAYFASWCFSVAFGKEWVESGQFVQVLSILFLLQLVTNPIGKSLYIIERQDLQLLVEAIRMILVFVSFWLSSFFQLSPLESVLLFSLLGSLCCLFHAFLSWRAIQSYVANSRPQSAKPYLS